MRLDRRVDLPTMDRLTVHIDEIDLSLTIGRFLGEFIRLIEERVSLVTLLGVVMGYSLRHGDDTVSHPVSYNDYRLSRAQIWRTDFDQVDDTAESFLGKNESPRHFIYWNRGGGEFEEHLVHEGTPTHEAKVPDLTGDGRPNVVSKDDWERGHVNVWYNET